MSHTSDFFAKLTKAKTVVYSAMAAIWAFVPTVAAIARDPFWTWLTFIGVVVATLGCLVAAYAWNEDVASTLLGANESPLKVRRRATPDWIIKSLWSLIVVVLLTGLVLNQIQPPHFGAIYVEDVEVLHPIFSRVESGELHAGSIKYEESPSIFLTNAFYLKFMVRKAPRYSSAMIEKILVEVTEFQPPLPEKFPVWGVMPLQEDNLYIVNIDEPKNGVSETFVCEHYFTDITKRIAETRFAAAKLEDQPEKIILRIDAKQYGLYKFKVSVVVSAGDKKETIPVASETVHYPLPPKLENNVQEIGN